MKEKTISAIGLLLVIAGAMLGSRAHAQTETYTLGAYCPDGPSEANLANCASNGGTMMPPSSCPPGGAWSIYTCSIPPESCQSPDVWSHETQTCDAPPAPSPEDCAEAIATGGGNGSYTINSDGTWSCMVGIEPQPIPNDPEHACSIADGTIGTGACFHDVEEGGACESGHVYGTVNGFPVCVQSASTSQTGTSDPHGWGQSTSAAQVIAETQSTEIGTDANGDVIEITTTETTTQQTTTDTQPNSNAAPYTCEDGRLAADLPSCDSAASCSSGYYLAYGVCVALPATSTTETNQETSTAVTQTNQTTGQTQTSTGTSTTTTPGTGGAAQKVEFDFPSSSMPAHTDTEGKTWDGELQAVYTRIQNAPAVAAMSSVANIFPDGDGNCPALSMDLSATLVGEVVSTNVHCDIAEDIRPILAAIMLIFWVIVAFRVFASA